MQLEVNAVLFFPRKNFFSSCSMSNINAKFHQDFIKLSTEVLLLQTFSNTGIKSLSLAWHTANVATFTSAAASTAAILATYAATAAASATLDNKIISFVFITFYILILLCIIFFNLQPILSERWVNVEIDLNRDMKS